MITPFICDGLFDINPNYKITYNECVVIVYNWYLNYEDIHQILVNMPVARWKWVEGSRNFIDYYDCRPAFPIQERDGRLSHQGIDTIKSIITEFFGETKELNLKNKSAEYNYFKHINRDLSNSFQHFPHFDYDYNVLIYLDKINSGGTALYNMPVITNNESLNLFHDISLYPRMVVSSAPNRMVIFDGRIMHGGYIEDHNKYVDDWRINQVMFFEAYE